MLRLLVLAHAVVATVAAGTVSGQASFQGLGDLPGGREFSRAEGVSADGSVVVGESSSERNAECLDRCAEGFRWTKETGMMPLGDFPEGSFSSRAYDISADGTVIIGRALQFVTVSTVWTQDQMFALPTRFGGCIGNSAHGISPDGRVVVGTAGCPSQAYLAVLDAEIVLVGLGELPGGENSSFAEGASIDGAVVVGDSSSSNGMEAFRWTSDDGMIGLGDLPGGDFASQANDVSADGSVIVGLATGPRDGEETAWEAREAFRWTTQQGMVGLGHLPNLPGSAAHAVSLDGSVIVGESGNQAFIWDELNGMRHIQSLLEEDYGLDLSNWTLGWGRGVSADGTVVVGNGWRLDLLRQEAWIATIPRPSCSLRGDADCDGDVDLADFLELLACLGEPSMPPRVGCSVADLDGDEDVDLSDLIVFQAIFTGSN